MATTTEVRVPDLGNFPEVAVIDVLVKPGDTVEIDTPLVTLETEKATMDVPSSAAGVVEAVHVQKGGKVSEGALIVTLRAAAAAAPAAPAQGATASAVQGGAATPAAASATMPRCTTRSRLARGSTCRRRAIQARCFCRRGTPQQNFPDRESNTGIQSPGGNHRRS